MKFRSLAASCGAFLLFSGAAFAQCSSGSSTALTLESWSAVDEGARVAVTISGRNNMGTGIRLADATVWFRDALGGSIGGIPLERNITAGPGEVFEQHFTMAGMQELVDFHPDDISASLCTAAVVQEDGTVNEVPRGAGPAQPFSDAEYQEFVRAVSMCYSPPLGAQIAAQIDGVPLPDATVEVELDPDASVVSATAVPSGDEEIDRAVERAVTACAPYRMLPESSFENWQHLEITLSSE